jgi:predicted dehydrogenase
MVGGPGTLGVGLIGCGGMGRRLAQELAAVPEARLVAVCDVVPDAAAAFGVAMGVPFDFDHHTLLARSEVDAVIVATPNGRHTPVVLEAVATGRHVFCEKPLALTVAECDAAIAAAARHGVRLLVGHVLHLMPQFRRVLDLFAGGTLGAPLSAQVVHAGWFDDPQARYRLRRETAGGLLFDITIHELDFLLRLFGPVASVTALTANRLHPEIDYEDDAHLLLRFRSGAVAQVLGSLASRLGVSGGLVLGDRGSLRYEEAAPARRGGTITYRLLEGGAPPVTETLTYDHGGGAYALELGHFAAWVLHDVPPPMTAADARAVVAVIAAAYASAERGAPVVPEA